MINSCMMKITFSGLSLLYQVPPFRISLVKNFQLEHMLAVLRFDNIHIDYVWFHWIMSLIDARGSILG